MAERKGARCPRRVSIRLVGIRAGTSQDQMVEALQPLYKGKGRDEIWRALARLPLVLTRSIPEDQALKVQGYLEPKGAILEIAYAPGPPAVSGEGPSSQGVSEGGGPQEGVEGPPPGPLTSGVEGVRPVVERRAKPRVNPGIHLHPMGVGEILSRSFGLLQENFWTFFLILFIPQGAALLVGKAAEALFSAHAGPASGMAMGVGFVVWLSLFLAVFLGLQIWGQGALIHAVSETYLGHRTSVAASYAAIWPRLGPLLGTMLLLFSLVLLGTLLLVVPGVILLVNWLMADKVVVLEGLSGRAALGRSRELLKTRTEPGFSRGPKVKACTILLVGLLMGLGIRLLLQVPGAILQLISPDDVPVVLLDEVLKAGAEALGTTYVAIAMILYYYDLRTRIDGFDLRMMAENL